MRLIVRLWVAAAAVFVVFAVQTSSASAALTLAPVPAYTKTSGNFTTHFSATRSWQTNYRVCVWTYHRAPGGSYVLEEGVEGGPGTSPASVCTNDLPVGTTPLKMWPYETSTVLPEGHTYQFCAAAYYWNQVIWQTEAQANGTYVVCATTTIDRSRPTISVNLANGQPVTNSLAIPIRINYQDSISPPWPGPGGTASNWVCWTAGTAPCTPTEVSSYCGVPAVANSLVTAFNCQLNVPGEGHYTVCAVSADSGIPDSPSVPWNGSANSQNANLSLPACASVLVDTTGPAVTASANAVNVTVGQLVTFSATASDPAGTSGAFTWDFGDNTTPRSGASTTHTYTQAGTFVARATTNDGLGNPGTGTVTITVTVPTGGAAPLPPLPGAGPGTVVVVTPPGSPALTRGQVKVSGAVLAVAPTSAAAVSTAAGGGGTRVAVLGTLRITAPKLFTVGRLRLPTTVTLRKPGSVSVTLLRGTKKIATGTLTVTKAGTAGLALKVPKTLVPGAYTIRVIHRRAGVAAITRNLPLTVRRAPPKKPAKKPVKKVAKEVISGITSAVR